MLNDKKGEFGMLKIMSKTDGFPSVFDFKSIHSSSFHSLSLF